MVNWIPQILILAQGDAAPEVSPWGPLMVYLLPALFIIMIGQIFFGRADAKEKSKRDEMISSLKKNDRVITIGGIIGTFVSLSEDKKEVTIRVDDNTRLKMLPSAIREIIPKETKDSEKAGE
ncbi:MAG: preprotein translocase subunit YajC [Planctomycetaceae bacterium]|nr:preprotein translocase subunit YajC [Planctomycetaceae bacterium]